MLAILAKLSTLKFNNLGLRCFNTLKDLMNSAEEMEPRIIELIKKDVINKMIQNNPESIPVSLLEGLQELVGDTGKSEILKGLFENCFPSWIRFINEKVKKQASLALVHGDNIHFDSIIALLAVAI